MPEALDAAAAGCNRKGNRERALQNALRHDHSQVKGRLQAGLVRGVSSQPQAPPSLDGEVNRADKQTIEVGVPPDSPALNRIGSQTLIMQTA